MKNRNLFALAILTAGLFFGAILIAQPAHATFAFPKRVMIDEGQRTGVLTIYNQTDIPMLYNFSWERRGQTAEGENVLLEDGQSLPGYRPADPMLVLSPRQVIIPAGQSQKVRIMVRRPANLEPGEYLSHILIQPEPATKPEAEPLTARGFGGALQVRTNLSLPVFVRHGKTALDFNVTQNKVFSQDGRNHIRMVIENNSSRSLYAKPVLECTKADGTVTEKTLKTVRMYTQAKRYTHEALIPADTPPLNTCQSLNVKLYGLQDLQYGQGLIQTIAVQR